MKINGLADWGRRKEDNDLFEGRTDRKFTALEVTGWKQEKTRLYREMMEPH